MRRSYLNFKKSIGIIDILLISGLSVASINSALAACDDKLEIPLNDSKKSVLIDFFKNEASEEGVRFKIAEKVPFNICKDNLTLILSKSEEEITLERDGRKKSSIKFLVINNQGYQFFLEIDGKKYPIARDGELVLHVESPKCAKDSEIVGGGGRKLTRNLCSHNDHASHFSHYSSVK